MVDSIPRSRSGSQLDDASSTMQKPNELFLERLVSIIPLPYYMSWICLAGIFFLFSSIALFHFEHSFPYIWSLFVLSILIAQQPIIVIWAHNKMKLLKDYLLEIIDLPESEISTWYEDQMAIVFDWKKMLAFGALMALYEHVVALDQFGFIFQSAYLYIIIRIDFLLTEFLMGIGLYPLLLTGIMVYKISKLPMNVNVLLSKNLQIKGLLYSKFTICAASVYAVWGCFNLATPAKLSTSMRLIEFSFFAVLLLAYFILPQYSIHQMIMKTKKEKLEGFSRRLMENAKDAFDSPNRDNISTLRNFLDIERQLDEMCVWPFGSYEVLHIALIVVIPLMVVLLEVIFGIIK